MIKFKHKTLTFISGALWLVIGLALLIVGLNLVTHAAQDPSEDGHPLMYQLSGLFEHTENAAVALIAFGLFIGYFKGRYALGKSAQRIVKRILTLPNPCSLGRIYPISYYLLVGVMILIGISFNYFNIPKDIRGFIDVAIGAALINGAIVYFRLGMAIPPKEPVPQ